MATKNSFVLEMLFLLICVLTSCSEVAALENYLIIERRELSAASQIGKEIYQLYKYYDRRKKAIEIANWTLSEAENHVDEQCHNSKQYCCLNDIYLDCLQCCQGPRPTSSALIYSPAPSPLPNSSSSKLCLSSLWKSCSSCFILICVF
ncbi:hypothetical protein OWV82_012196 [Melia azedarach]|uniref:Uncharacterized protein n=1 Tax=Melia azedarach TaxID=155640 RepID=A0ACC1Y1M7_MELAZ|nr:hypothetical protein OWV82_012196 [Melia azedarach]